MGNGLLERLRVAVPAQATASDGTVPMYNPRPCQSCHVEDGCGHGPVDAEDDAGSLAVRPGIPLPVEASERYVASTPQPVYGRQLSDFSITEVPADVIHHHHELVLGDLGQQPLESRPLIVGNAAFVERLPEFSASVAPAGAVVLGIARADHLVQRDEDGIADLEVW